MGAERHSSGPPLPLLPPRSGGAAASPPVRRREDAIGSAPNDTRRSCCVCREPAMPAPSSLLLLCAGRRPTQPFPVSISIVGSTAFLTECLDCVGVVAPVEDFLCALVGCVK